MPQTTETYYYINGRRVPLTRRDDLMAIKLAGIDRRSAVTRSSGGDIPNFQPPAAEDIWPGGELVVQRSAGVTRSGGEQALPLRDLNQRSDVEYASPIFEISPGDRWIATNQLIAQFNDSLSEFDVESLGNFYGVERLERIDWLPRGYVLRTTPATTRDVVAIANALVEGGHVRFAHPNFLRKYAHRTDPPAARVTNSNWHLLAIDVVPAWQISRGKPTVQIAIIDDGVDLDHSAFPNQASHFNAIDRSNNPRPPTAHAEFYTHGTACAGLAVGAPNAEVGTSGVAPGCRLMAVRLLDRVIAPEAETAIHSVLSGEDTLALSRALSVVQPYREALSIQWAAEHGAAVISNSWGPPDGKAQFGIEYPIDDITRLAVAYAVEKGRDGKGCVICWAAGNGNESVSFDGYASHPDVLAVAAVTRDGTRAPYSDFGPEVDICAPGGGYSDGLLTTVSVDPASHAAYRDNFNGTSAATPIVAGVAGLLLSEYPDLTYRDVFDILKATADKIDADGGAYDGDGHSMHYGYGRINAAKALEEAQRRQGG